MKKVLIVAAMLILLLSSTPVFGASSAEDEYLNSSIKIREQLGFNTKISDVQNINSNTAYQKTEKIYGIALTDEEVAEMNVRNSLLGEASKLENLINPDNYTKISESPIEDINQEEWKKYFAGLYLDNKDNGKIKIGIVDIDRNGHLVKQMLKTFSLPNRVQFFNASINKEELSSIQDEITPLFKEFPISESSVSLKDNKIVIGLRDLSYTKLIESRLSDFARKNIEFTLNSEVPEPYNTRAAYSFALRGGLGISTPVPNQPGFVYNCTSAFNARKEQPNGTYLYYVITAAHCGSLASVWSQGGTTFGSVSYRNYGGQSDMLAIQITNTSRASAQIHNNDNDFVNITEYETDHTVGTYVCTAGRNLAGPRCGTILDNDFSTSYTSATGIVTSFAHVVKVSNNQTSGGDSGGSVYARIPDEPQEKRGIYGVLSGGVANDWYFYSKAGRVFADLSMTQILTTNVSFP